jgi:hypothetical protein
VPKVVPSSLQQFALAEHRLCRAISRPKVVLTQLTAQCRPAPHRGRLGENSKEFKQVAAQRDRQHVDYYFYLFAA